MAKIKAFRGRCAEAAWFNEIYGGDKILSEILKETLEARGAEGIGTGSIQEREMDIRNLLNNHYFCKQDTETMYVYEQESMHGKQHGIWAMSSVQDFTDGKTLKHEQTLLDRELRISAYRESIGIEGSPILLSYRNQPRINEIINEIINGESLLTFSENDKIHRLWLIDHAKWVDEIIGVFESIDNVYIGDGHHRLAAAGRLQDTCSPWIMALFVSTSQIKISAFNRLVLPSEEIDDEILMGFIKRIFFVSAVPFNVRYTPDRLHRIGLFYKGQWFQLDLKPDQHQLMQLTDVSILQEKLFEPFFKIAEPQTDPRLHCYPSSSLEEMLEDASYSPNAIVFTLYPMSVHKLIEQAEQNLFLPPKSTFIEPKVPYGLLLNAQLFLEKPQLKKKYVEIY